MPSSFPVVPIIIFAGTQLAKFTLIKRPDDWHFPGGTPEQRAMPEGKRYEQKVRRAEFCGFGLIILWYVARGAIHW